MGLLRTRHRGLRHPSPIADEFPSDLGDTPTSNMRDTNAVSLQRHRPAYRTSFFRLFVAALQLTSVFSHSSKTLHPRQHSRSQSG